MKKNFVDKLFSKDTIMNIDDEDERKMFIESEFCIDCGTRWGKPHKRGCKACSKGINYGEEDYLVRWLYDIGAI